MTVTAVYNRREPPDAYDPAWFDVELANIAKAEPRTVTKTITASLNQATDDSTVLVDCTSGAVTYTLLSPTIAGPFALTIQKVDSSANAVTISGTVDGVSNPTLTAQWQSVTIVSDGVKWVSWAAMFGPVGSGVPAAFVTHGTFGSAFSDTGTYKFPEGMVFGQDHKPVTITGIEASANTFAFYGDNSTSTAAKSQAVTAAGGTNLFLGRYQGTPASPTGLTSGLVIGNLQWNGYDGTTTNLVLAAGITATTTQIWSGTAHGAKLTLATVPNGSTTLTTALTLDQDQSATFAGAVSGITTLATSSTINGQTISSAASFTGTVAAATAFYSTVLDSNAASDLLLKRNGVTGITLGASSAVTFAGAANLTVGGTSYVNFTIGTGGSASVSDGLVVNSTTASGFGAFLSLRAGGTEKAVLALKKVPLGGTSNNLVLYSNSDAIQAYTNGTLALTIDTSQNTTLAGTLTVSGASIDTGAASDLLLKRNGTTGITLGASSAVTFAGAVSGVTTLGVSGLITMSGTNRQFFGFSGVGTGYMFAELSSTGADCLWGIENSTGGALASGTSAYAAVFGTNNATALCLTTSGSARLTIAAGGGASFVSGIGVHGASGLSDGLNVTSGDGIYASGTTIAVLSTTGWNFNSKALSGISTATIAGSAGVGVTFQSAVAAVFNNSTNTTNVQLAYSSGNLALSAGAGGATGHFVANAGTQTIGVSGSPWAGLFAGYLDSGAASDLLLKRNGTTIATVGSSTGLTITGSVLSSASQFAVQLTPTFTSAATAQGYGLYVQPATAASAFTMTSMYGIYVGLTTGAGSSVTNSYGLYIANAGVGSTQRAAIFVANDDDSVLAGSGGALATNATRGFTFIPTCAGTPTGVPANDGAGRVALIYDTTNKKLCAYSHTAGAWQVSAAFT